MDLSSTDRWSALPWGGWRRRRTRVLGPVAPQLRNEGRESAACQAQPQEARAERPHSQTPGTWPSPARAPRREGVMPASRCVWAPGMCLPVLSPEAPYKSSPVSRGKASRPGPWGAGPPGTCRQVCGGADLRLLSRPFSPVVSRLLGTSGFLVCTVKVVSGSQKGRMFWYPLA